MAKLFMLIWCIVLAGCSYFAPDYHKPQLDIPGQWPNRPVGSVAISESLPYLAWWQKFNDPTLNHYIESGLVQNMNIQVAKANLEAAQGQLLSVKLNWVPFLSVFGGYISGSSQNSFAPIGNLGLINNSGGFLAILPAYTLNVFSNYTLQKQANYNLEVAENAELSVRLAVIAQVAAAYFANLAQGQLVRQFSQLNQDLSELILISRSLNQQGLAEQISLNELNNKQQLLQGQLALAAKNLVATQNALRFLINQVPGQVAVEQTFAELNPNLIIPGNLPLAVIAARPDVLKAEAQLKAANEGISVASSALLPSVSLNYFYAQGSGSQTLNPSGLPSAGNTNSNQQNYSAAYANWTISPSVFGQIDTSSAVFKAALANYKLVVNSALHETDNALASNTAYNDKMRHDLTSYQNLQDTLEVRQALYQRGLSSYMLVLSARLERDVFAVEMTTTKLQQLLSLVNLYQSLGGGYQYQQESSTKSLTLRN